ncbi:GFA family protein [Sphingomonas sp. RT2P30]|uniref:GFA family protein n=1 Tax=Parasphingomonas halimpatiens TaxID=3096162 RepID=UPI002FC6782B
MTELLEGGCRCGAARYTLTVPAMPEVYCCHCNYCQSWSGSAFTQQVIVPAEALTATGPIITYGYDTDSGATSTHRFCATCHTRLWNDNTRLPGSIVVRAGTLDASDTLVPAAHIWVKRKQPWIVIDEAVPSFAESPSPAEFLAIVLR